MEKLLIDREYKDLRGDGRIVLFLREGKNPKYHVRLKIPKAAGYKFVSTKTNNLMDAQRIALDLYDELYIHVKSGGVINTKTYADAFKEWETYRTNSYQKSATDRTVEYVKVYSVDYFDKMRIEKINSKDFHSYWEWRKLNFKRKMPTDDTLNRERTSILSLFKFCHQRGYITEIPNIPKLSAKGVSRRPTFTKDEWRTIYTKMREWVKNGKKSGHWKERYILQKYVLILSNSGMRIGELRGLKWDDITTIIIEDNKQYVCRISGKTGERDVVLNPGTERYLRDLYDLRRGELNGEPVPLDEHVFFNRATGKPISSFKAGFNSMLKHSGIPTMKNGKNRTLYSLRHFYATQRLRGDINPYMLSKQMGTSVDMIEKYYGHILTPDVIKTIRKSSNQNFTDTQNTYPFE